MNRLAALALVAAISATLAHAGAPILSCDTFQKRLNDVIVNVDRVASPIYAAAGGIETDRTYEWAGVEGLHGTLYCDHKTKAFGAFEVSIDREKGRQINPLILDHFREILIAGSIVFTGAPYTKVAPVTGKMLDLTNARLNHEKRLGEDEPTGSAEYRVTHEINVDLTLTRDELRAELNTGADGVHEAQQPFIGKETDQE